MRLMKLLSLLSALALIGICFLPWITVPSKQLVITGTDARSIGFGKPALIHFFLSGLFLLLVLIGRRWALVTAFFMGAFNFSWALRNYISLTACGGGECPEKHAAIYLLLILPILSIIFLLYVEKPVEK